MKYGTKISGTGMYVPEKIVTNHYLSKIIDTSNEWIEKNIGIKERRLSKKEEMPSDLSVMAAKEAIINANLKPEDIELIVLAATSPDMSVPATAAIVQEKIGSKEAAVFDIRNSCQGFVTALITASKFISDGTYKNGLVIGTSAHGKLLNSVNWRERTKSVFFGDGSGAIVLEKCQENKGVLSVDLGNKPSKIKALDLAFGGISSHISPEKFSDPILGEPMDGKEIWNFTTTDIPLSIKNALEKIGKKPNDLDFVILHQANINIIKSIMGTLEISMEKTFTNIEKYGNTSEASVPIALHEALQSGKIKKGDLVALSAFGGGLGWATAIIKWD